MTASGNEKGPQRAELRTVEVQTQWCTFGCGTQISAEQKRQSVWGGCAKCESSRLGMP